MQDLPPILDEQLADAQASVSDKKHLLIIDVPIENLKFADYNPRTLSQHQFESLQRSINEWGFVEPVVVNSRNMTIVGGHQRVRAAKALEFVTIPTIYVNLDAKKERALNVALNKISGDWDDQLLAELLDTFDEELIGLTGFTDAELEKLTADPFDAEDTEEATKTTEKRYTIAELVEKAKSIYPAQFDVINDFLRRVDEAA